MLFTAQSLEYTADITHATRDQITLAAQGQIADRFNRAVDQLGQAGPDKLSIRLGGIYSLERIMKDSPADEPTVIEVLCAFVRTNAPRPAVPVKPSKLPLASEDVRAALTVLARRPNPDHHPNSGIDLSGSQLSIPRFSLRGADLRDVDLRGANLRDAELSGANLYGADLSGADLSRTDLVMVGDNLRFANLAYARLRDANLRGAGLPDTILRHADLSGANLIRANLNGANLYGAYLSHADLRGAYLRGANLSGADLRGADLRGADLRGAHNLDNSTLRCVQVNDLTQLPPGLNRPLDNHPMERSDC
ncbi:pentapeptide repeat-containing protein [Micromonospora sp. NPDC051196]|uniref:pentapeptide repeat-containing protein n=1 Tax=Micromonospora sp. NPDC051196 TaxID=3155281 RepID=UPI0034260E24